ncbi:MAG: Rieske 2Fe-2S domain-containing protein [Ardenticatenales bacterium]|nr:Rieske 2Fe-2S domain-containing protein [Ardenticatenales bacterium]
MTMWLPAGLTPTQLNADAPTPIDLGGQSLLLLLADDEPMAISRTCPHAAADLTTGDLYRRRITCPKHGYKFDLESGRCLYPADENYRLRRYAVELRDGLIWIQLPDGA